MAFNTKQREFMEHIRECAKGAIEVYDKFFDIRERFTENYSTGQLNDLSGQDSDMLQSFGFEYADIATFANQACENYVNFFTNQSVSTREYGKDIRKIARL